MLLILPTFHLKTKYFFLQNSFFRSFDFSKVHKNFFGKLKDFLNELKDEFSVIALKGHGPLMIKSTKIPNYTPVHQKMNNHKGVV